MFLRRFIVTMLSVVLLSVGVAWGQPYPNKAIRIVTATAGGGGDFVSRQIAQGITGALGQPLIVDNRGSGVIQADILSSAPPDGYTLLVTGGAFWILPLMQKVTYNVEKDFSPLSYISREVSVVVVNPSIPVNSIKELIAYAKARPGQLNYSSSAIGGPQHLGAELFKSMAGVNIVHVPYKGGAPAVTAVLSGEVQMAMSDSGLVAPHVKSGKLRALAVTSATPSGMASGLPTVASVGLPGYEAVGTKVIFAPGKTPRPVMTRLSDELLRFLNKPDVRERFLNSGEEVVASTPQDFADMLKSDIVKWRKVIADAGIKAD